MSDKVENESVGLKVNKFLENKKKIVITSLVICILTLAGVIIGITVSNNVKEKNLALIDEIKFNVVDDSLSLSEEEIDARLVDGIEQLQPLVTKGGIVGARANMLAAEFAYLLEKYEDAANYWIATASKGKKTYIEPIAYFNLASCYETMGKLEEASENYKLAAENEDFILNTHAKFSYGRSLEALGKYDEAVEVYTGLFNAAPNDSWAMLGKTRIIDLQIEGKAE